MLAVVVAVFHFFLPVDGTELLAVADAVFYAAGRGDCSRGIFNYLLLLVLYFLLVVDAGFFAAFFVLLGVGCSLGIFNCCVLWGTGK